VSNAASSRRVAIQGEAGTALVYPEQGFQLHAFAANVNGRTVDAIYGPTGERGTREPDDRRYGNPVLFPSVGVTAAAEPDRWMYRGRAMPMQQHGWARDAYWHVEDMDERSVTGVLVPTTGIRTSFPFAFELRLRYGIEAHGLALTAEVANRGDQAFPYALGFHPYLSANPRCRVRLPAGTRLRSDDSWRTIARAPSAARDIDATDAELPGSIVLADTEAPALDIEDPVAGTATRVSVEGSEQAFPVWVVWSGAPDARYLCLEPWTDVPNALNRSGTRTLAPGGVHHYRMMISVRRLPAMSDSGS
jgi:galactose mutarotase-like enzyme